MGEHKSVKREELPPEVVKVLVSMQPGQVSDLVQVQSAYTILRLGAHTPAHTLSFEAVKTALQQELQKDKYEKLRSKLAKQLRANAKVELV
jgi:parvulin-like peptidyl-prolyl isomerase